MVKYHSDSERGNPLPPHGAAFHSFKSLDAKMKFQTVSYITKLIFMKFNVLNFLNIFVWVNQIFVRFVCNYKYKQLL